MVLGKGAAGGRLGSDLLSCMLPTLRFPARPSQVLPLGPALPVPSQARWRGDGVERDVEWEQD